MAPAQKPWYMKTIPELIRGDNPPPRREERRPPPQAAERRPAPQPAPQPAAQPPPRLTRQPTSQPTPQPVNNRPPPQPVNNRPPPQPVDKKPAPQVTVSRGKPKPWYLKTIPELIKGDKPPPPRPVVDGSNAAIESNEGSGRWIPLDLRSQGTLIDPQTGAPYISNAIKSSHYTVADFIPRQLVFQFTRVAHFYLLVVSILQLIPGLSTTGNLTTIVPLIVFIYLLMVKEGYYDFMRHKADVVENNQPATVLRKTIEGYHHVVEDSDSDGSAGGFRWVQETWECIEVGDVIRLSKDQSVPADILLLHGSGENRYAHIDTMALDGETNLKSKAPPATLPNCSTVQKLLNCQAELTIEDPNADLYRFDGTITINGETLPVTMDQVVYRGSTIRNTSEVFGLVLNTGEDCKIRMNAEKGLDAKKAATDYITNHVVAWLMLYVLVITTLCSVGYIVWRGNSEGKAWYLDGATVPFVQIWFGFLIMFNQIIPLSLYIGLEAIKMGQLVMVVNDLKMYHNESNTPAWVNNTNNLDDLGQISYVFTDKTGTLTENIMNLRRICVAGVSWLHRMDLQKEAESDPSGFLRVARENTTEYMIEYIRAKPNSAYSTRATRYIMALALCHTCLPTGKEGGEFQYEGSSPDEVALVRAAMQMGFIVTDRSSQFVTILLPHLRQDEQRQVFQIMDVIQFSSDRKRMSVILKCPDGRIWLICKGADSILLPRLADAPKELKLQQGITNGLMKQHSWQPDAGHIDSELSNQVSAMSDESYERDFAEGNGRGDQAILLKENQNFNRTSKIHDRSDEFLDSVDNISEEETIRKCFDHVDSYAAEGLRTLIYADRFLSEDEYLGWKRIFREAETSLTDRQQRIEEASEQIEKGFSLIGASAVEDKLQDGVPETIEDLRRANIKIFMLTGDKRQTAINIAHSARICTPTSSVFVLDVTQGDLEKQVKNVIDKVHFSGGNPVHTVVVVDGHTLSAIQDPYAVHLIQLFCQLVPLVDSVICCRASPAQKALLVSMVHDGPNPDAKKSFWSQIRGERKPLTLAIGDGANDVSMILTATVGVGIAGREGQQAARVADFSIGQFRYLSRLLLVHGHYNYHRVTMFILTTFWREMYTYTPQAFYQIKVGATGTSLYHPTSLMFVSFFTAATMIVIGSYEQVLSTKTLAAIPELYAYGQRGEGLNSKNLLIWVINSLVTGAVTFFAPWASYSGAETVEDNGLFAQSSISFLVCIIWINYKIMILDMHHKTSIVFWCTFLSIVGLFLYEIVTAMVSNADISHYAARRGFVGGFGADANWWLSVIWTLGLLIIVESAIRAFQQNPMFRSLLSKCLPGSKSRRGGGVREGFSDWEHRLWQEMEQDPAVERLLTQPNKS